MEVLARPSAVMSRTECATTKPVKSHIVASKWVLPESRAVVLPGCHKSTCRIKNGVLMGHENISSLCQRTLFEVAMQWAHWLHQFMMSVRSGSQLMKCL